jgi:membrane-bound lytic murein transglycosylase D
LGGSRALFLILLLLTSLLAGCASAKRQSAPKVAQQLPQADPPPPPSAPAAGELECPDRALERAISEARQLVELAHECFEQEDPEEGRSFFRQALDRLSICELDPDAQERAGEESQAIVAQIQRLELLALLSQGEWPSPDLDLTPFEQIADLNLFTIEVDPHLRDLVSRDLLEIKFDVPVVLNDSVLRFLNFYQNRGRRIMQVGLNRSGRYVKLFEQVFAQEGVPLDLIYLAHVESLFRPEALSRAKAKGIWQFMAGTGRLFGLRQDWWVDERSDILKSTVAAARYLKSLHECFGDWHLAMAAYNGGPGRIERIIKRHGELDFWTMSERRLLPTETSNFVPSILAALIIFKNPGRYGFEVEPEPELEFETVEMEFQVDLRVVSDLAGVPVQELRTLNPELRHGFTPYPPEGYVLKVPPGKGELLSRELAELPAEKRVRFQHHRVRKGETLSMIAREYSTSIEAIARHNNLRSIHRLSTNQDLIIPSPGWQAPPSGRAQAAAGSSRSGKLFHIVRRGESLGGIARAYRVRLNDLLRWNRLKMDAVIHPGQRIFVSQPVEQAELPGDGEQIGTR